MLRILPVILILLLISGGLIFWRFNASKNNLESPNVEILDSELIEVPKTLPDASLDDKVEILNDAMTTIVSEINSLKRAISSLQSQSVTDLDNRLKAVEASLTELKIKVSALEGGQTTQTTTNQTTTTNPPLYIPLSSGGQTKSQDYVTIETYQISLNPADYAGYKNMQLEVSIRRNQPGNTVYARLYNSTDGSVTSSEVSTTSSTFVWLTSSGFSLASGTKTYVLQVKVGDGTDAFVQSARIKVNY
ncbi:MAG: hypothetical protein Q8P92_01065 [Candidatus Daviesbacteria bacterium]|nr:hypothetical protein [Candidatus Daviesbacteria bacterium]